jgi:hypothetical protein
MQFVAVHSFCASAQNGPIMAYKWKQISKDDCLAAPESLCPEVIAINIVGAIRKEEGRILW